MLAWNRSDILSLKAMDQPQERTCATGAPLKATTSLNGEMSMAEEHMHIAAPSSVVNMAERAFPPLQTSNHIAEPPVMHGFAVTQSMDNAHASESIDLGSSQYPSSEMPNIRSWGISTYHVWPGQLCWSFGPYITKMQQVDENDDKPRTHCNGIGLKLTARLLKFSMQAVMFQISYLRHLGTYSLHCSITLANVVPKNSRVMDIVRVGDPETLGKLFETGRASYRDTAPDGTSLLHVSLSLLDGVLNFSAEFFRLPQVRVA